MKTGVTPPHFTFDLPASAYEIIPSFRPVAITDVNIGDLVEIHTSQIHRYVVVGLVKGARKNQIYWTNLGTQENKHPAKTTFVSYDSYKNFKIVIERDGIRIDQIQVP